MATTNWSAAGELQSRVPHTYTSMEHLVMAMASAHNNQGKKSIFGHDKGLKSYLKFEEKLKETLLAMVMDGLVDRSSRAQDFHDKLVLVIDAWKSIFPNWPDAYQFADLKFRANNSESRRLISSLIGVKN